MASINNFEELIAWQKARELAKDVWCLTVNEPISKDFSLIDQMRRSSGSVMDNIAEGFERGGNKEFVQFLSYSKGSLGETKSQLYRAFDRNHINQETLNNQFLKIDELGNMIGGLMRYLKNSKIKGTKFNTNH